MVMTDPIADFLTRIRNANQAKHEVLEVARVQMSIFSFACIKTF